jgi:hypothetical protein
MKLFFPGRIASPRRRGGHTQDDMRLLNDPLFRQETVRLMEPTTLYRLLKLVGEESAGQLLRDAMESALSSEDIPQLRAMAEIFQDEGRLHELESKLVGRFSSSMIEEILDLARRRIRRGRMVTRYM